ncbi:hypothetical protein B0H13DRAFT_2543955 [Mycena leptocephala]|nr:hypothetical protein B0H13DRAFT_2543955 [Mycena leptocephala]
MSFLGARDWSRSSVGETGDLWLKLRAKQDQIESRVFVIMVGVKQGSIPRRDGFCATPKLAFKVEHLAMLNLVIVGLPRGLAEKQQILRKSKQDAVNMGNYGIGTQPTHNPLKSVDDLLHGRSFKGVLTHHVRHQWFHILEAQFPTCTKPTLERPSISTAKLIYFLSDEVPKIVHVCGERIAIRGILIIFDLKFWYYSFVAANNRALRDRKVLRFIPTRKSNHYLRMSILKFKNAKQCDMMPVHNLRPCEKRRHKRTRKICLKNAIVSPRYFVIVLDWF